MHRFKAAYRAALEKIGYSVEFLAPQSNLLQCLMTTTFNATRGWDLAVHMRYAKLNVFREGDLFGTAVYDATNAGARPDKFISAEKKIEELVNQLFPNKLVR